MTSERDKAKRWPRFSLASLLLLFALICVFLAGWNSHERWSRPTNAPIAPSMKGIDLWDGGYSIHEGKEGISCGWARNNYYWAEVSDATVLDTPSWHGGSANPPLSAGKAVELANRTLNRLIEEGALPKDDWALVAAELTPWTDKKWLWLVRFEVYDERTGPSDEIIIPVLMNGIVPKPKIVVDD